MEKIELPRECYKYSPIINQIASEGNETWELESINCENEIQMFLKDSAYPYKTFVNPEILENANITKRIINEAIKVLSQKQFIPGVLYTVLSVKRIEKLLHVFNSICLKTINGDILKDKHLTAFSREFQWCVFNFLYQLGIEQTIADKFSENITHLIEHDNAYRFRIQDILSETTKDKLRNRNELNRLAKLALKRSTEVVGLKFVKLAKLISYSLLIPKLKKAYNKMLDEMTLESLQYDESDRYWVALRKDFDAFGLTYDERKEYIKNKGWKYQQDMV